jgi:hypothetical protein
MTLFAPDILQAACGLSVILSATGLVVGALLWALGWRWHRFWIVVATTVVAGILGLYTQPMHGMQPLVAGVLLALAAGVMALALARLVAFASGGLAAWLLVHSLAPAWNEPFVCFLAGGLLGVFLFRLWTMALTSLCGTLLLGYSCLCLLDRLGKINAIAVTESRPHLLNAACLTIAGIGIVTQLYLEQRRAAQEKAKQEKERQQKVQQEMEQKFKQQQQHQRTWWGWAKSRYRRAG